MTWNKELNSNITTAEEIGQILKLSEEEIKQMGKILELYPMSITPYYLSLIDFNDPNDPIRKMCIPSIQETQLCGTFDTSGEKSNTVMEGLQHKYASTAMILSTNQCAMYCRHCFRKRLVGLSDEEVASHFDEVMHYVREHKEIHNALISGGDSFLNSNETIEKYLKALTEMEHIDFIRFGTRVPVVFPQRITEDEELLSILNKYNQKRQINIVTHFNHPREFTPQSIEAIKKIRNLGIAVRNQTVLLKGVNDNPEVLADLLRKMTQCGVTPYYIFQCRPVTGVKNQFQVPLHQGIDIVEAAKAMQNGHGKCFKFALSHESGKIEIVGKLENGDMIFKYHQAKHTEYLGHVFIEKVAPNQCWLEDIYLK